MTAYKTKWFDRWARKEGLTPASLCDAVREMAVGRASNAGELIEVKCDAED